MNHHVGNSPPKIVDKDTEEFKILDRQAAGQYINVIFETDEVQFWWGEPEPQVFGLEIGEGYDYLID